MMFDNALSKLIDSLEFNSDLCHYQNRIITSIIPTCGFYWTLPIGICLPFKFWIHDPLLTWIIIFTFSKQYVTWLWSIWFLKTTSSIYMTDCFILKIKIEKIRKLFKKLNLTYLIIVNPFLISTHTMTPNKLNWTFNFICV